MRTGNLLFSAVHFFVILIVASLGTFCLALAQLDYLRVFVFHVLSENSPFLLLMGISILTFALFLFLGLYWMNRKHFYRVSLRQHAATVDESIVRDYVNQFWKQAFPDREVSSAVSLGPDQKIDLLIEIPPFSQKEEFEFLKKIEADLGAVLEKNLGYGKEFDLTVVVKN